jgi:polysaccharide pyruvyl transferase WcaK-like protein
MKNVLFNTTRQWNPGDEFILMGILRMLSSQQDVRINPMIYNRHPDLRWGKTRDNSINLDKHDLSVIDAYVAAGTPEWESRGLWPLFEELDKEEVPCVWWGIGQPPMLGKEIRRLFSNRTAKGSIICRDHAAASSTKSWGSIVEPCPALYASDVFYERSDLKSVAVTYTFDRTGANRVSSEDLSIVQEFLDNYARKLRADGIDVYLICHYIDDVINASSLYKDSVTDILYSYDAQDYMEFFLNVDFVIGHRLHGAIVAAGTGAPGMVLSGSPGSPGSGRRSGASKVCNIPCQYFSAQDIMSTIGEYAGDSSLFRKKSEECVKFRREWEEKTTGVAAINNALK